MKKLLTLILITALLSCKNENYLEVQIEDYIKNYAKDPSSYEPMYTITMDTFTYGDLLYYKDLRSDISKPLDSILYVFYMHECRLKNGFGALDIMSLYILTDKNNEIFEISDDASTELRYRHGLIKSE